MTEDLPNAEKEYSVKSTSTAIVFLLLCLAGVSEALADHGYAYGHGHGYGYGYRASVGVVIGPYWGPGYYPPPTYYYPPYYPPYYAPVVVEPPAPQVYIEQQATTPETAGASTLPQTNYWYYCRAAKGYYPYVQECPGGWQRVSPQPPGQP